MLSYISRCRSQFTEGLRSARLSERLHSAALSALNIHQDASGRGFATSVYTGVKGITVRGKVPENGLLALNSLRPNPGSKHTVRIGVVVVVCIVHAATWSRCVEYQIKCNIRYNMTVTATTLFGNVLARQTRRGNPKTLR